MKTKFIMTLVLAALATASCNEEERGQYAVDSTPPGNVTNIRVENLAGGAIITYDIPDDDDLLYVKAIYKLSDGRQVEQKSSAYTTQIKIEGLGRSAKQTIRLICGDRSRNESTPSEVEIEPLDAPIYDIIGNIEMFDDFGGIRLEWMNPDKANIVLTLYLIDEKGVQTEIDNVYSGSAYGVYNLRGFPPEEAVFGVVARDRWGNHTDMISGRFTPYFEEKLDRTKFTRWNPPGIPHRSLPGWPTFEIEHAWDGVYGLDSSGYGMPLDTVLPASFTFDSGQLAKISRFKVYQIGYADQFYSGYNIKKFELWGSATPNVSEDFATWIFLGTYESIKPSGLPLGGKTQDDYAIALAGHDYNIQKNSGIPIRYFRFHVLETFGGSGAAQLSEIEMWGEIVE